MKFGKEFASQVVPEWREAYLDYKSLKDILKHILHFRRRNVSLPTKKGELTRKKSLHRAFSGLTSRFNHLTHHHHHNHNHHHEDEVILVSSFEQEEGPDKYETMFLRPSDEGGEIELMFFNRLDDEFNKVLKFYKRKVDEVLGEADQLNKQMNALTALRMKVDATKMESLHVGTNLEAIQEVELSSEASAYGRFVARTQSDENVNSDSSQILDQVKINIAPETPLTTIRTIFGAGTKSELSFSEKELKKIEAKLKQAFIGFYQKLRSLKGYCFLNMLAFSKLMKKYDKVTSRSASKTYLQTVDNSYLGSSDEVEVLDKFMIDVLVYSLVGVSITSSYILLSQVNRLIERVEATFVKHFSNGNRRKGMNDLRPQAKRERHRVTFFLGLFSGCSIALLAAVIVVLQVRNIYDSDQRNQYMENIFPLYSLFTYMIFHMIMYAGNIYFWRRYQVNYTFIFGFEKGTELGYREVLLLGSGLSVLMFSAVLSNLEMEMDPRTKSYGTLTELVPLGLVLLVLLVTFCPFNIIYRSSRFFLIRSGFHCLCAPFYKVTLPDFFLADQLTSQVQAIRSLQFYICYYGWGDFRTRSNQCSSNGTYKVFYVIVAVIPYWVRFIQCVRRLVEEKDFMQALNGLKYFSTIVAVVMRTGNELKFGASWKILAAVSSGIATIASTYWDIVIDWGLLDKNSRNPWLRDKLLVPQKSVYFLAIVVNGFLRFAWVQSVLGLYDTPFLHRRAMTAVFASLEILRRGIWNFFRLENEHLNNVGKYRAFKSVPLPFHYSHHEPKDL